MTRSLEPFDFAGEDEEDAATVLMSGHQRHLMREALRTPAPLEGHMIEPEHAVAPKVVPAPPVAETNTEIDPRFVFLFCGLVLTGAFASAIYSIVVTTP